MTYVDRFYREQMKSEDLHSFRVVVKDTDLYILVDKGSFQDHLILETEELVSSLRKELENYIQQDPNFKTTLTPHVLFPNAPIIAQQMVLTGNIAQVGPMAAVAGAFSDAVGNYLLKQCKEVIVENGGDLFIFVKKPRKVAIFAGKSPLSNKVALEVGPLKEPIGICTSSGTVGPSLSFGNADAAVVVSPTAALSDAVASAVGNKVHSVNDLTDGVNTGKAIPNVKGVIVIKEDKMAAWGELKIIPIQ